MTPEATSISSVKLFVGADIVWRRFAMNPSQSSVADVVVAVVPVSPVALVPLLFADLSIPDQTPTDVFHSSTQMPQSARASLSVAENDVSPPAAIL